MWEKSQADTVELEQVLTAFMERYGLQIDGWNARRVIAELVVPSLDGVVDLPPFGEVFWDTLQVGFHGQEVLAAIRRTYLQLGVAICLSRTARPRLNTEPASQIDLDLTARDRRMIRVVRDCGLPGAPSDEAGIVGLLWKFVGPQPANILASSRQDPMWPFWKAVKTGQGSAKEVHRELVGYVGGQITFTVRRSAISWE